jgi:hypothetical protein
LTITRRISDVVKQFLRINSADEVIE